MSRAQPSAHQIARMRQGVPAEFRPRVWVVTSKAEQRRAARPPNYYESMASLLPPKSCCIQSWPSLQAHHFEPVQQLPRCKC